MLLCSVPLLAVHGAGQGGPPSGYALLETLTVPVDGSVVTSTATLDPGVTYRLRASGSFTIGGPGFGDAEYAFNDDLSWVIDNCGDSPSGVDLGIGVNDAVNDNAKAPDWGAFDASHVYEVAWPGTGAPIQFNYHDCGYADNVGSLTVDIFAPAAAPPTASARLSLTDRVLHTAGEPGLGQVGLARAPERLELTTVEVGPPLTYRLAAPGHRAPDVVELARGETALWWSDGAARSGTVDEGGDWSVHLAGEWRPGCLSVTLGTASDGVFRVGTSDGSGSLLPAPGDTRRFETSTLLVGPREGLAVQVRNTCAAPVTLAIGTRPGAGPASWIERGLRVPATVALDPWLVHDLARGAAAGVSPVRIAPMSEHGWVLSDAPARVAMDLAATWVVHLEGTWPGPCFFGELGALRDESFVPGATDGSTFFVPFTGQPVALAPSTLLLDEGDLLAVRLSNRCTQPVVVETRGPANDPGSGQSWIEVSDGSVLPRPVPEGPSLFLLGAGLVLVGSLAALGVLRGRRRERPDDPRT